MRATKVKSIKAKWNEKIRIVKAETDLGEMYYLVDSNYNFIPLIKEYLHMIQAQVESKVFPNTAKTYCYLLWYFVVFLKIRNLKILDLDGKHDILAHFKH
jgi:integrase/recombinase XerD